MAQQQEPHDSTTLVGLGSLMLDEWKNSSTHTEQQIAKLRQRVAEIQEEQLRKRGKDGTVL